jgi:tryptophanyl-tRNA synthetase
MINNLSDMEALSVRDYLTPELKERIEEAERECREGRCVTCKTKDELVEYLESL